MSELDGRAPNQADAPNALYAYVGAFVNELARSGLRHAVVCPGSRSTPLALALAGEPRIRVWMHVDERSAAYFALGLAKARREPVALLCTSGTAAANFLPAVAEANLSHIPLVVLTADRPPELRDDGAPQAIDQQRLYGTHAKWYAEAALPEATNEALRYVRTLACRAVATARATPAAPVHLNFPFREPLTPDPGPLPPVADRDADAWRGRPDGAPYVRVTPAVLAAPPQDVVTDLAASPRASRRGLIVVGPQSDDALAPLVAELADQLGYPVLADPLSGLRGLPGVLATYDAFLRSAPFHEAVPSPDVVLRFGAMPTSKPLLLYLKRHPECRQIVVDAAARWEEPTQLASDLIQADPGGLCRALLDALPAASDVGDVPWHDLWTHAEATARAVLAGAIAEFPRPFEGRVFTELANLLPDGATLVVGNSMPVRDCDTFFWPERRVQVLGNRGANGIDGVVSTALGVAAADPGRPVVLVIGDLSFYHDLNGLLAARLHGLNLTIVLVNNDGGGIFSFLPQADHPEHFEQLFGTPTGLDFAPAVAMYGGHFEPAATWDAFRTAVTRGLRGDGLRVVELCTERAANVAQHRELWSRLDRALAATLAGEAAR